MLWLLLACTPDPRLDQLPLERIEMHLDPAGFADFSFHISDPEGACPRVAGLVDSRVSGVSPSITRSGGRDALSGTTTGENTCFTPVVAFAGLTAHDRSTDLVFTVALSEGELSLRLGDQPLQARTLTPDPPLDVAPVEGRTVTLRLDPPAPLSPVRETEILNIVGGRVLQVGADSPVLRGDGAQLALDVPAGQTVRDLMFRDLWAPTITGCPEGVVCVVHTQPFRVAVREPEP